VRGVVSSGLGDTLDAMLGDTIGPTGVTVVGGLAVDKVVDDDGGPLTGLSVVGGCTLNTVCTVAAASGRIILIELGDIGPGRRGLGPIVCGEP
jgi:hypothetical protein